MAGSSDQVQIQLEATRAEKAIETYFKDSFKAQILANPAPPPGAAPRSLTPEEQRMIDANVVAILNGRREWLRKMRELKQRELALKNQPYNLAAEQGLNQQVDGFLKSGNQAFVDMVTQYRHQPEPVLATASNLGAGHPIQQMLSNFTNVLGGNAGPFAMLGQLLQEVFKAIFSIIPMFKKFTEKFSPQQKPQDLLNAGEFEDADVLLKQQERKLIGDMKDALAANPNVNLTNDLTNYEKLLDESDAGWSNPGVTPDFKKETLKSRIDAFETLKKDAESVLELHNKQKELEAQIESEKATAAQLSRDAAAAPNPSPKGVMLAQRLQVLEAELQQHERQRKDVLEHQEGPLLVGMHNHLAPKLADLDNAFQRYRPRP